MNQPSKLKKTEEKVNSYFTFFCPRVEKYAYSDKKRVAPTRTTLDVYADNATLKTCIKVGFQGLRRSKNRSILGVCEDFETKRNAEITLLDTFCYYSVEPQGHEA